MMTWTNFVGAGSPVSKLCPDGESHNLAPVKCFCWLICQNKLYIKDTTQQISTAYAFLYSFVGLCVFVCARHCIRAPWNLSHTSLVLFRVEETKSVLFLLSGDAWRRQSLLQKYSQFTLWVLSIPFIMNSDSIHSAVVCAVLSYSTSRRTVKPAALFNRAAMRPLNTDRSKPDAPFWE